MASRHKKGMTLVEIIFAFAIVSTLLTLAYAAALSAWQSAVASNQRTQAQYLVQQSLEAVKAYRESNNFVWGDFLTAINSNSGFHIVLLNNSGNTVSNGFVCPAGQDPCHFQINSGGQIQHSIGANTSLPDNTEFNLVVEEVEHFVAGQPASTPGRSTAANVTAVTLVARITWTNAQGVVSNLAVSTILTEPGE